MLICELWAHFRQFNQVIGLRFLGGRLLLIELSSAPQKGNAELFIPQTCKLLMAPFYILKVSNQGFSFPSKSSFLRLKHPLKIVVNLNCCDART